MSSGITYLHFTISTTVYSKMKLLTTVLHVGSRSNTAWV